MELTRRGWAVAAVGALAAVLGVGFGARSLEAVVVPVAVALGAGYLQLRNVDSAAASRDPPPDGFVGESGEVTLRIDAADGSDGRPVAATVEEAVDDGLAASASTFDLALGGDPVDYEIEYERRGSRSIGPATVRATDVFGLFEQSVDTDGRESVLVYPPAYPLSSWGREVVYRMEELGRSRQREEFERLREYVPGDSLRDVHWRTTAKREEIVVKEFAAEVEAETVTLAGGADPGGEDAMAAALTSLALSLLSEGVPVAVRTPERTVETGPDRGRLTAMLEALARVGPGDVDARGADVVVDADGDGARVTVGDRVVDFDDLVERDATSAAAARVEAGAATPVADGDDRDAEERPDGTVPTAGEVEA